VVPEAAAAGCLLVGNKSLDQQVEIAGGPASGLFFEFGSYEREVRREDQQAWLAAAAAVIAGEMARDRAVRFKTYCRRKYNRSAIFRDYYQPVLAARRAEAA
jgi:hypothetical protein